MTVKVQVLGYTSWLDKTGAVLFETDRIDTATTWMVNHAFDPNVRTYATWELKSIGGKA